MEIKQSSLKQEFIDTFNDKQIAGTVEYFNDGTVLIKSSNESSQFYYKIGDIIDLKISCYSDEYDDFKLYVEDLKDQLINQRPFEIYEGDSDIDASGLDNETGQ